MQLRKLFIAPATFSTRSGCVVLHEWYVRRSASESGYRDSWGPRNPEGLEAK
jgi:hypothetical protein